MGAHSGPLPSPKPWEMSWWWLKGPIILRYTEAGKAFGTLHSFRFWSSLLDLAVSLDIKACISDLKAPDPTPHGASSHCSPPWRNWSTAEGAMLWRLQVKRLHSNKMDQETVHSVYLGSDVSHRDGTTILYWTRSLNWTPLTWTKRQLSISPIPVITA